MIDNSVNKADILYCEYLLKRNAAEEALNEYIKEIANSGNVPHPFKRVR